jgi:hypothetical protein
MLGWGFGEEVLRLNWVITLRLENLCKAQRITSLFGVTQSRQAAKERVDNQAIVFLCPKWKKEGYFSTVTFPVLRNKSRITYRFL